MNLKDLLNKVGFFNSKTESTKHRYRYPVNLNYHKSIDVEKQTALYKDIPKEELYPIGPFMAAKSPQSHVGPFLNAIDFLVLDGTMILAAADGKIIELIEDSDEWGDGAEYRDKLNYMTVEHNIGGIVEYSQYCHLVRFSARDKGLKIGDYVKKGQQIASVGKTGWTDRDHLHFIVFRMDKSKENPYGFKSLKINFE